MTDEHGVKETVVVSGFLNVHRGVRGLFEWRAKGWREDTEAEGSVCTFPGQDPEEGMGWGCLERLFVECV